MAFDQNDVPVSAVFLGRQLALRWVLMNALRFAMTRGSIRDWVGRHPLITFVILAYGISWIAWLLARRIDVGPSNAFSMIGAAGPALAGLAVSALIRPESSGVPAGRRWRLFCFIAVPLAAALSLRRLWLTESLIAVAGRAVQPVTYPSLTAFLADLLAAGVLAILLSSVDSPLQGPRDFLRSLAPRRQPISWYGCLAAIGLYPAIVMLGNLIGVVLGLSMPAPRAVGSWCWIAVDAVLMFFYVMVGGGGLEEPGWRGLALPLLQERYGALPSSLFLAAIWAFWHWPLFWWGYSEGGPFGIFPFVVGAVPISILLTAAYNRSGGSLPVVILLHTSFNIAPIYLVPSTLATLLWMLLIAVVAVWMWRSPQTFSPHPR